MVIEILPLNPRPMVAVMVVGETMVKEEAAVPPNLTEVDPVKLEPVMVTRVPAGPDVGLKELMIGGVRYVNPARVPVPCGLVTATLPVAPVPTTAVILEAELTTNDAAGVPPKLTAVAPVKLLPLMVTLVPVAAAAGVKD